MYVRYAEEELYAVLLLEAHRNGTVIVGEDLGTVPQYVPRMMNKHGLRRMYVVQYEIKPGDNPVAEPLAASVASINTHDMPTFAGFWKGKDIEDRVEQGLLDERGARSEREKRERMRNGLIRYLAARGLLEKAGGDTVAVLEAVLAYLSQSAAEIVLVALEDLWLEEEPQNVPGLADRSWRRRLRLSLEQAREDDDVRRILRIVNERRRKSDGNEE
jgi:4-alpha-glucanotransferase